MAPVSSVLQPPKARLQALLSGVEALEARAKASRGISVLEVASCGHQACGAPMPDALPADCLILQLGCEHQIPPAPALEVTQHQSRAERSNRDTAGRGLTPERQRQAFRTIALL